MVVTEAPTNFELNANFAFASDAGRITEMVLREAGLSTGNFLETYDKLSRADRARVAEIRAVTDPGEVFFYHLNTAPVYGPDNKILPPTEEESFLYAARFAELVTLLLPEHILMLGNGAVGPLLGRMSAGASAGATLDYIFPAILARAVAAGNLDPELRRLSETVPKAVVSTDLHPAILLTNAREITGWTERVKKLAGSLGKKISVVDAEITVFDSFDRARNFLTEWIDDPNLKELSYDWETIDLKPALHRESITLSFGVARDPEHGYCIPTWHRVGVLFSANERIQLNALIGRLLRKERKVTLGHNLLFDNLVSRFDPWLGMGKKPLPGLRQETMYLAYVNDETGPQGLKELCNLYTDLHCYDDTLEDYKRENKLKGSDYARIPLNILGPYNAYDAIANFRIRNALIAKLKADPRGPFLEIAFRLMSVQGQALEEMAFNGQKVDREICFREGRNHEIALREAMMKLMASPAIIDFIKLKRREKAGKETRELMFQPKNLTREYVRIFSRENPFSPDIRARVGRFIKLLKTNLATLTEEGEIRLESGTPYEDNEFVKAVFNAVYTDRYEALDPAKDDLEKWKPWLKDEEYQADEEELLYYAKNAGTGYKPNFNTHGGGEMGEFFFTHLKLPVNYRSEKTNAPSLSKEARPQLVGLHPTLTDFFTYKDIVKEYSGYFKPLIRAFRELDRGEDTNELDRNYFSHLEIETGRTVTGRTRAQRLQTFPRKGKVKNMYVSRFDRGLVVQADMSQAELRVVASLANEKKMIEAYLKGEDLHKTTSVLLFGDRFTNCTEPKIKKEMRALAKRFNFGIIYGSGAQGLVLVCKKEGAELLVAGGYTPSEVYEMTAEVLKLNLKDPYAYSTIESTVDELRAEVAEDLLKRFYVAYPDLKKWTEGVHAFLLKKGYYPSPFGRIRRLSASINSADVSDQNEAKRQAQNFPVQSAASDIAIVALSAIHSEFARRSLRSLSFAAVHDSLLFDSPLEEAKEVAELARTKLSSVKENFAELLPEFDTSWIQVPFETDVEIGPSWGVSYPYRDGKMLVESVENGAKEDLLVEIGDFWDWYGNRSNKE